MKTIIRSNAAGTVNRSQLRRLAEKGKLEARLWYYFDGRETQGTSCDAVPPHWYSVVLDKTLDMAGQVSAIDREDFESSSGRAYIATREGEKIGQLRLRIHSNLIYELRVCD